MSSDEGRPGPRTDPPVLVRAREVRVLEGPNLYFTRPAVKVTLEVPGIADAPPEAVRELGTALGMPRVQPGAARSGQRQRVAARLAERAIRLVAAAAGTRRLGVRSRSTAEPDVVVVAFVWRHRGRAEALGSAVADLLSEVFAAVLSGAAGSVRARTAVAEHGARVASAPAGDAPWVLTPQVPVASVTGTNGKTTTTRLIAHISMTAGLRTAWSSTDGVVVQGEVVEPGDYSGPAGARGALGAEGVQLAVLETARGGMLLRGLGVSSNDVSVVTNVSADHLGQQGIDTVDQLAEVKAIVTRVTSPAGWAVLNGDDPRVWAMRAATRARPWVFTEDPDSPAVRQALDAGGRAMTLLDGDLSVLTPGAAPQRLVPVLDVPLTIWGLSRHNTANALAAAAAALALGVPRESVVEGLRSFAPDAVLNPGRMNTYTLTRRESTITVIVDLAHNEAGLEALLDVARGLVAPGGRVHLGLGTAGDRTDDLLVALGEIAGLRADRVVTAHKEHYLRGRSAEELEQHLRVGLTRAGVPDVEALPTELAALGVLVDGAVDGDVVAMMCHAERAEIAAWLEEHGATPDDAASIRRKVVRARGEHDLEAEIAALWALDDAHERIEVARRLYAGRPGDARVAYEYAGTHDSAGDPEAAVPIYHAALDAGLREPLRHRAQLQLASSLRNLGRLAEAVAIVDDVTARHPESVGAAAFSALVHHDAGDPTGALRVLLGAVAATSTDPDVARYRRSLTASGEQLGR